MLQVCCKYAATCCKSLKKCCKYAATCCKYSCSIFQEVLNTNYSVNNWIFCCKCAASMLQVGVAAGKKCCNLLAAYLQHTCSILAAYLQHTCSILAALKALVRA